MKRQEKRHLSFTNEFQNLLNIEIEIENKIKKLVSEDCQNHIYKLHKITNENKTISTIHIDKKNIKLEDEFDRKISSNSFVEEIVDLIFLEHPNWIAINNGFNLKIYDLGKWTKVFNQTCLISL